MLERHNGLEPDPEGAFTYYDLAQATIADLQGQLEAAKKKVAGYDRWLSGGVYYTNAEFEEQINDRVNVRNERAALKQRVAQLEGELATAKAPRVYDCGSCAIGKGFEQRVAQLEGDVEEQKRNYLNACETIYKMYVAATGREGVAPKRGVVEDLADLRADHARVLGLVQALPMAGLPVEHARSDDFVVLQANGEWMVHTYNYWAKFATEEEARAYIALLEYRASLPAQPAQGGA